MKLSNENIEEYILLLADQELAEAEEAEVLAFIEQHAVYKPMLEAYLATRLDTEESYTFPEKESLLQPESVVLPLQRKAGFSALKLAAAITVLAGLAVALSLMFSGGEIPDQGKETLAGNNQKTNHTRMQTAAIKKDTVTLAGVEQHEATQPSAGPKIRPRAGILKQQLIAATTDPQVTKETVPAYLEDAAVNKTPLTLAAEPQLIVMVEQMQEMTAEKSLPGWLPVNQENLQGVNDLIAHIQVLKENIQEKTQSLKNTAFVINIGNRQFSIGK